MSGISSLLEIGKSALNASQVGIQITGQNIANVNTPGYSRQQLILQDAYAGGMGTGVKASEIQRMFDKFIEQSYNDKASSASRYNSLYQAMQSVEATFNESSTGGISACLTQFFKDWQNLSTDPTNSPQRQNVLSDTQSLISILRQANSDLDIAQYQANQYISQDVANLNGLLKKIADINRQLPNVGITTDGSDNGLLDERAQEIRQLAQIIDINVVDNGGANLTITDKAGHTLVDGTTTFDFKLEANKVIKDLNPGSNFNGTVSFSGTDNYEYTVRVVQAGDVSSGASAAQFQVSLDGGVTWLRSDSGAIKTFSARPSNLSVGVGNLQISFAQASNAALTPTGQLQVGDNFTVTPKMGLFWYKSAATPINITPQISMNGQDNETRVTGGSLAGYFQLRDTNIGNYKERLNALAKSLIWETNRLHSQGAGQEMLSDVTGTYQVRATNVALGSDSSGLTYSSNLTSGASMMYVYNAAGQVVSNSFLDFDSSAAGLQLFNPAMHTLSDVAGAVNNSFGNFLTASIVNNELQIDAKPGYTFGFGADATGLWAALGINTFFAGEDARSISLNPLCGSNTGFINAGQIDGTGQVTSGNNVTALGIAGLNSTPVTIGTTLNAPTTQSLQDFYNSLVGKVGADTESAQFTYNYENTLAQNLNNQQQSVAGVNLDEEMSNLIKYQHSYQAAAKMISTADQMWQTVLGLKQ